MIKKPAIKGSPNLFYTVIKIITSLFMAAAFAQPAFPVNPKYRNRYKNKSDRNIRLFE